MTPYVRRLLRLMALPYCYLHLLNWRECTASRWQVFKDMLHIFFVLKYFPDNYGPCRLWEKSRTEWEEYYGSSYDPWQRARLRKSVQRHEYEILFEDKEVCLMLCRAADLPVSRLLGVVDPEDEDWRRRIRGILEASGEAQAFVKPVTGSAGEGVHLVRLRGGSAEVVDGCNVIPLERHRLQGRFLLQSLVQQCKVIAAFNPPSVNTLRILTLYTRTGEVVVIGGSMRFGVGNSCRDNWSAGGVATGVDVQRGILMALAYDKQGNRYTKHPTSGVAFRGFAVPMWDQVLALARRTQSAFPFYRLLGQDIAITDAGPMIIEINAFPDLVFQEQTSGPLLADARVLREFSRWDLLINARQRALLAQLDQDSTRGTSPER